MLAKNENIFLYPASICVPEKPAIITTILGSCVAVCFYDCKVQIGGINHYMLPLWNGQGLASPKFGNIAIEKLLDKLLQAGAIKSNIIAKVFGGGEVLATLNNHFNVGERNIDIAKQMLSRLNIPIMAQSTGGKLGRKILFNTNTGEVVQKYVKSSPGI